MPHLPSPSAPTETPQALWTRDFTLLTLSNFLMCCAYYSLISTLPLYMAGHLGATEGVVGMVMAAYVVAAILIRPFCGFGLDRYGRKGIFLASLAVYAVIFNGYLLAGSVMIMLMVRFVHGMTWGLTTTSNTTVAGDVIPASRRGRGFGHFGVSTTAGMAIGPLVGAYIYSLGGYEAMFLSGCGISLVSMAMASAIRYPRYYKPRPDLAFDWGKLFEARTFVPSLNVLVLMLTYGGLVSFVALYGKETGRSDPAGFFLVYAMGIISSRFFVGKSVDRNGPRRILVLCISLLVIGFPMLALWQTETGYVVAGLVLGFGNGVVFPTFQTITNNLVPASRRGAASSTLYIAVDLGMGLGMVLVGQVAQHLSISAAFMVCSLLAATGLVLFLTRTQHYYMRYKVV